MNSKLAPVVLLDIEGTTTSISFVKDVLFPFARSKMEEFVKQHWADEDIQKIVGLVREQSICDVREGLLSRPLPDPEKENDEEKIMKCLIENLFWQMDNDRKTTPLKELQGKIWNEGYLSGVLKGHVYEDVPLAFERWFSSGAKIYIYSSGSVQAQILLFKHSEAGDLTKYISGNFDTTSGPKVEPQSYITIASKIGVDASQILFFTDITREAEAAKMAEMKVVVMIRPGNAPLKSNEMNEFATAWSFEEFNYEKLADQES